MPSSKEYIKKYNKYYRETFKDKVKSIQDAYYQTHRLARIKHSKDWKLKNPEKYKETRTKYLNTPSGKITSIKGSAKTRKIEYNLSNDLAKNILSNNCYYCGYKEHIGIDRINNDLGYVDSNCVACCEMCNYMKRTYSKEQFILQCKKIAKYQSNII